MVQMDKKEMMIIKNLAEYIKTGEEAVHSPYNMTQAILWGKLARSGQIPSLKITGQWWFKKEILDNLGIFGTGKQGYKVFLKEKI